MKIDSIDQSIICFDFTKHVDYFKFTTTKIIENQNQIIIY